jgi:hypothetical protein
MPQFQNHICMERKKMSIDEKQWEQIRRFWGDTSHVTASPNMPICIFATVDEDGSPRVAPYSSLILYDNKRGFYFDQFSHYLTKNLDRNRNVCILLLKNNKWFWIKTVLLGQFDHPPGIRLMGTVGKRREATTQEINAFKKPLRKMKLFKGYKPLWGVMQHGRDIFFDSFETVKCGPMKYVKNI